MKMEIKIEIYIYIEIDFGIDMAIYIDDINTGVSTMNSFKLVVIEF